MSRLDDFLDAAASATGFTPTSRNGSTVTYCPGHEADGRRHRPSLSVTERGGKVLVRCFAGCETANIVAAIGWTLGDLQPVVTPLRPRDEEPRPDWVDPSALGEWAEACRLRLLNDASARLARRYLRQRGVDGDLVRHYGLGFATDDAPDNRLAMLRNRIVVVEWPWHAEGRLVPGLEGGAVFHDVKWLSAKGATKQWWRASTVDPTRPVLLVEGALDVLGAHHITDGNAVAILSKVNCKQESVRRLARRGVTEALVSLDHDADASQWGRVLSVCADNGLRPRPVVGPPDGMDWGDLLTLDDEAYYPLASRALTTPEVGGVA